ncbi:unnamed protein product [Musa textilis]
MLTLSSNSLAVAQDLLLFDKKIQWEVGRLSIQVLALDGWRIPSPLLFRAIIIWGSHPLEREKEETCGIPRASVLFSNKFYSRFCKSSLCWLDICFFSYRQEINTAVQGHRVPSTHVFGFLHVYHRSASSKDSSPGRKIKQICIVLTKVLNLFNFCSAGRIALYFIELFI